MVLFTTESIHPDDPPDDHGSDRCPARGVYEWHTIWEVEGVLGLPLLGRMRLRMWYTLTHTRTHTRTYTHESHNTQSHTHALTRTHHATHSHTHAFTRTHHTTHSHTHMRLCQYTWGGEAGGTQCTHTRIIHNKQPSTSTFALAARGHFFFFGVYGRAITKV